MASLVDFASALYPELFALIGRDASGAARARAEAAIAAVTGARNEWEARARLDEPGVALTLKARLAEIALVAGAAMQNGDDLSRPATPRADAARRLIGATTRRNSSFSFTASVLSIAVTLGFFAALLLAVTGFGALDRLEPDAVQIVNLMLGALATAFATVLNFWLGSSLGSRRKDARAAQASALETLRTPDDAGAAPFDAFPPPAGRRESDDAEDAAAAETPDEDVAEDGREKHVDAREVGGHLANMAERPLAVPAERPAPFAHSSTPLAERRWPVKTRVEQARIVSFDSAGGKLVGARGRRFLADRNHGRYHVGVDLFAERGDIVCACEDGRIVNFYPFYRSSKGDMSYALLVAHADFVVNYGEVAATSQQQFGWAIGDQVTAGQPIGAISGTGMLHFESYAPGTTASIRWRHGEARPPALLNPTLYLLELSALPG